MADIHVFRIPQWDTDNDTHDRLVQLIHSKTFNDLTDAVIVNFHIQLLPKANARDKWRKATLTVPRFSIAQRIVELYGCQVGKLKLPWEMQLQWHTGPPQEALFEHLRTTRFVDPVLARQEQESRAIPVAQLAYGRLMALGEEEIRWSAEYLRPADEETYAIPETINNCFRLESAHKPAIILDVRNVQLVFADEGDSDKERTRVILFLHRPAQMLLGPLSPVNPTPGQLLHGRAGSQGAAPSRCSALGPTHARVAPYLGKELLLEFEREHWRSFEATVAELGLTIPFYRKIKVEQAERYSFRELIALQSALAGCGSVAVAFQLDALAKNGDLTPAEVVEVARDAKRGTLAAAEGELRMFSAINALRMQLTPRLIVYEGSEPVLNGLDWRASWKRLQATCRLLTVDNEANTMTSRVFVTPTRFILEGPFPGISNRILRAYGHNACFLRVGFVNEDLSLLPTSAECREFIMQRYAPILRNGIDIGGRHYDFLAYSMSSLQEHCAWFVTPFVRHDGRMANAETIRAGIGDLSALHYLPARYAARISQAFTGTECSVTLLPDTVIDEDDIYPAGGDEPFTDGVGLMSEALARKIHSHLPFLHAERPEDQNPLLPAVQVRIGGSKGMLSLDMRLTGERLIIRPSMRKFLADEGRVEICRSFREPSKLYLNRPFVQILEALGVPKDVFMDLQRHALERSEIARHSAKAAWDFVSCYSFGEPHRLQRIFHHIESTLDMPTAHARDPFLNRVLDLCIHMSRHDIKHKARVPIRGSYALVGVADVHGGLKEGEIYACIVDYEQNHRIIYIEGDVAISRSPTEHPGDIQMVRAVGKMPEHLRKYYEPLKNVVVFNTKGSRPLPSMLSGGDLDGDVFALLLDPRLHPITTVAPLEPSVGHVRPPMRTSFPVTGHDMAAFFLEYMQADNLGTISSIRQQLADYLEMGPLDAECIELAILAGAAVDFRKTGAAVASESIPLPPIVKPDWMRPDNILESARGYYRSRRALGHMFRAITLAEAPVDTSDEYDNEFLLDAVEKAAVECGIVASTTAEQDAEELFDSYASALRRLCLSQAPALTEAEAMIGRALDPLGGREQRRARALAREVDAGMGALTKWVRDQPIFKGKHNQFAIFRYARSQKRRWGARSLMWLAGVEVLDSVAYTRDIQKRNAAKEAMKARM